MTNLTDLKDEWDLLKNTPMIDVLAEDLTAHSVELLTMRLEAIKGEISRTEQAIAQKGDARQSAESFFS